MWHQANAYSDWCVIDCQSAVGQCGSSLTKQLTYLNGIRTKSTKSSGPFEWTNANYNSTLNNGKIIKKNSKHTLSHMTKLITRIQPYSDGTASFFYLTLHNTITKHEWELWWLKLSAQNLFF